MGGALERTNFRGGMNILALEEAVWCRLATKLMGYTLTPVQPLALSECTSDCAYICFSLDTLQQISEW